MIHRLCLIGFALLCCSLTRATPPKSLPADTTGKVIVRIVSRDAVITASAGENGPVYSMHSAAGAEIVPAMPLDELQAQHSDLAGNVRSLHAGAEEAWAGLDLD